MTYIIYLGSSVHQTSHYISGCQATDAPLECMDSPGWFIPFPLSPAFIPRTFLRCERFAHAMSKPLLGFAKCLPGIRRNRKVSRSTTRFATTLATGRMYLAWNIFARTPLRPTFVRCFRGNMQAQSSWPCLDDPFGNIRRFPNRNLSTSYQMFRQEPQTASLNWMFGDFRPFPR